MKRLKTTICIVLCIISSALFGCSENGVPVMDDYRNFLENYKKYDNDDISDDSRVDDVGKDEPGGNESFVFDVNGFVPVVEQKYDNIELFAGGTAVAVRNDRTYIVKNGVENPADFIADENFGETVSFSGDYIIVEKAGKMHLVDFTGAPITEFYDDIEAVGNTAFLRNGSTFDILLKGNIVKRGVTGNYVLTSENFCKKTDVSNTVYGVPDLEPIYYEEFKVIDEPHNGIAPIKSDDKIGYADIAADKILIKPRYMYASQFSDGYATVRPDSYTDYPKIIDTEGEVKFDFGSDAEFTEKYSARDVNVYPCYDGYAIFSVVCNSVIDYGYVDLKLETPKINYIPGIPYENRAFGRYVVLTDYRKPFDLSAGCILEGFKADSIIPTPDGFIIKRNDEYSFCDSLFNELACGLGEITYCDGVYSIRDDDVFYICTYNDKKLH